MGEYRAEFIYKIFSVFVNENIDGGLFKGYIM